jgi:hypothetical protein
MTAQVAFPEKRIRRKARYALAGLVAVTVAGLVSPASKLLIVLFPALSLMVALYLIGRLRHYYIAFVCWLFFLTPMIRRIIEFRTGSATASFVMVSPFLACIAGLVVFRHDWSQLFTQRLRPWLYVAAAILYGTMVGLLSNPRIAVIQDLFGWISPICFSLYIYFHREHFAELFDTLRTSFLYGITVMGLYGIYQFFFLTPWDIFWMEGSGLTSIGFPEPMQVRVFSTMNTPQPFADFLIVGLLLGVSSTRRIRFLAMPIGLLALGLTMSRSAWIGGVLAMAFLSISFTARQRVQIAALLLASVAVLGVAIQVPEIDEVLTRRLQTFNNLQDDGSVNDRVASQERAISLFQSSPFGLGLGADARSAQAGPSYGAPKLPIALGDNGIEEIMLSFGWFGSIVFIIGFGGAVLSCFSVQRTPLLIAAKATLLSVLFQIPTMGIFPGAIGFIVWSSIGFCVASKWAQVEETIKSSLVSVRWGSTTVEEA